MEASPVLPVKLRDEPGRHDHRLSQLPFPLDQPPTPLGTPHPALDVHSLLPASHHLHQELAVSEVFNGSHSSSLCCTPSQYVPLLEAL